MAVAREKSTNNERSARRRSQAEFRDFRSCARVTAGDFIDEHGALAQNACG